VGIPEDLPPLSGHQSASSSSFLLEASDAVEVLSVIRYSGGDRKSKPNTPTTGRSGCSSDTASLASQHCATCDQPRSGRAHEQAMRDLEEEEDEEEPRQRTEKHTPPPPSGRMRHRSSSSRLATANSATAFIATADPNAAQAVLGSRRSSAPEIDQDSMAEDEVDLPVVGPPTFTRSLERTRFGQNNNNNSSARSSDSEAAPVGRSAAGSAAQHHRRRDLERAVAHVKDSLSVPPAGRSGGQRTEAAERTEIKAVVHRSEAGKTPVADAGYQLAATPPPMAPQQKRYSGMYRRRHNLLIKNKYFS
jgi:hypothetical protein